MTQMKMISQPQAQTTVEDDTLDLSALVATIWRGKWTIALITGLIVLFAGFYAFVLATPLYRATSVVVLETQQAQVVSLDSVVGGLTGDTSEVNTEVEILKSRSLMRKVVEREGLLSDPEFNGALVPPSLLARLRSALLPAPGTELTPEQRQARQVDGTVNALLKKVSVRNVPNSFVFQVTVESTDPVKSARLADAIVELYILNQLEVKFETTEQATKWLTGRVSELQLELEDNEARVKNFSAETELVSVEALQALEVQLKDLRDRIIATEAAAGEADTRLTDLRAATTRREQADLADDPLLNRLLLRLDDSVAMQQAFDDRFAQTLDQVETEKTRALSQVETLRGSVAGLEAQLDAQGRDLITLQQLTREAEASRLLYEYFLARLKETSAQEGIQQADSRPLSQAVIPSGPSAPRKTLLLAMAVLLGLMLGTGWVLFREARYSAYRTVSQLEAETGQTVLGQIPLLPVKQRHGFLRYLADKPTSVAAEAVRNLRTSVLLSNVDRSPKVIVSTSSVPGEGKTSVALALAQNLVGTGKTVLLIEGDIRRNVINSYFSNLPENGIVSVLSGKRSFDDVVHHDADMGFDLLAGEATRINAADLFSSDAFRGLIADMRVRYDYIVIDTPPVLVVPDARIIASVADALLFSVKWDSTPRQQVFEGLRMLESVGREVSGLVMTQIDPKGMRKYGYGGAYGSYAAYGRYYTN